MTVLGVDMANHSFTPSASVRYVFTILPKLAAAGPSAIELWAERF